MTDNLHCFWYIPNHLGAGHRGDTPVQNQSFVETVTQQARAIETHGWDGALLGNGWGRPDTLAIGATLLARTGTFQPLIAARPGYWDPAQFACAMASLDLVSGGRAHANIISGQDAIAEYGDEVAQSAQRYARTKEFLHLVRRLWSEQAVDFDGQYYRVSKSTVQPRVGDATGGRAPRLYFSGASPAAEAVAATEADVQLFWGEPLAALEERIARLRSLSRDLDRNLPALQFGLRITTLIRDTTQEAWAAAERKVAALAAEGADKWQDHKGPVAVGQKRLFDLSAKGDVLDENLYTAPGKYGAGGASSTWLVGTAEQVAQALQRYRALGITHFILSDTPYLAEIERQGQALLPLLRQDQPTG